MCMRLDWNATKFTVLSMKPNKNPPTVSCTLIKKNVRYGISVVTFKTALVVYILSYIIEFFGNFFGVIFDFKKVGVITSGVPLISAANFHPSPYSSFKEGQCYVRRHFRP